MDLRLRTRPSAVQSKSAALVEVAGELDLHCAPQLRAELSRVIEANVPPKIVVDLAGVTFLDSTGVGVLVGALKRARAAGGSLHFCNPQPRVCRVFEITGLIGPLPLFATRDEAFAAFDESEDLAPESGDGAVSQSSAQAQFSGAILSAGEAQ